MESKSIIFPRFKSDDLKAMSIKNVSCDLEALFNDIKVILSDTASESVQAFAKLKPKSLFKVLDSSKHREVFLKISIRSHNPGLTAEIDIYAELTRLMLDGHIPNLIRYIASFDCILNDQPVNQEIWSTLRRYFIDASEKSVPVQVLMLEKTTGIVLKKWIKKNPEKLSDFIEICIQIIYTLQCFSEIDFRHNDLHLENIFIEPIEPSLMFYFTGYDTYYMINTRTFVKIFDFDKSSFVSGEGLINEGLEKDNECSEHGMCSDKNNKFDLYTILFYLRSYARFTRGEDSLSMRTWINKLINETIKSRELMSSKYYKVPGRLCKTIETSDGQVCDRTWVPSDDEMLSPKLLLETDLFDQYRFTLSKDQHNKEFMNALSKPMGENELCYMCDEIYCLPSISKLDLIDHIRDVMFS